jgi:glycosyltransferase involved in cell wall biosynthesis
MRVLQVAHSAAPGGSNLVLLTLLRHQPPGAACACVFLEDGPVATEAAALVPTAVLPAGRARDWWRWRGAVRGLRGAIRAWRADAVLTHVSKAQLYAAPAAWLEDVPEVWWQHEDIALKPAMQRLATAMPAARVVCSAEWVAREQRALAGSAPVAVVHPGIELPESAPRRHRSTGARSLALGVVGRLARWKRVELAIRALPDLVEVAPGARLQVVGGEEDAGYAAELAAEAERAGVADRVVFAGHVEDAPAAIAGLDVLLHCAHREPFGIAMVEALAAGVPVVALREGGPSEIVRDGVDGRLVDDPSDLAAAVAGLARDPALRTRMGAAGRDRAARFESRRMAAEAWAEVARAAGGPT